MKLFKNRLTKREKIALRIVAESYLKGMEKDPQDDDGFRLAQSTLKSAKQKLDKVSLD